MRSESDKAEVELAVFRRFASAAKLDLQVGSERKGSADLGEPDVLCTVGSQEVAFELAEACAPEFPAAVSSGIKSGADVAVAFGEDVTHLTLRKKLQKRYSVNCPVHLLLYTDGFSASPDWYILACLEPELSHLGPFASIWLMGDDVHRVAQGDAQLCVQADR